MNEIFGKEYAEAYDALYADKNYEKECCTVIHEIFERYGSGQIKTILDLGCGTGRHAQVLARADYEVTAVDRSEAMLAEAQKRCNHLGVKFHLADVRVLELPCLFDAAILMFAVLGYQIEDKDVLGTFQTARRHLRTGGLLIFDVWNEPAVRCQLPSKRTKRVIVRGDEVERHASGELDERLNLCYVHYELKRFRAGQLMAATQELHTVRFFSGEEMETLMRAAGFERILFGAFPDYKRPADETAWTALAVARAI